MLQDRISFSNVSTSQQFALMGGRYNVSVIGTSFGTVAVQKLGPDGSTYLDIKAPMPGATAGSEADLVVGSFAANGVKTLDLAAGSYQLTVTTTTAVYAEIARVTVI